MCDQEVRRSATLRPSWVSESRRTESDGAARFARIEYEYSVGVNARRGALVDVAVRRECEGELCVRSLAGIRFFGGKERRWFLFSRQVLDFRFGKAGGEAFGTSIVPKVPTNTCVCLASGGNERAFWGGGGGVLWGYYLGLKLWQGLPDRHSGSQALPKRRITTRASEWSWTWRGMDPLAVS